MHDRELMEVALEEARAALAHDDVPVGAIVVETSSGELLARRHNERERRGDPTAHAELLALADAARSRGGWRLDGCTMVVTLEPCPMCAGALVAARLDRVVYGATDPKAGAVGSLYNLAADPRLPHELDWTAGVAAMECGALLRRFFHDRRDQRERHDRNGRHDQRDLGSDGEVTRGGAVTPQRSDRPAAAWPVAGGGR